MRATTILFALIAAVTLSGCASKFKTYSGPEVTRVAVFKESRKMYLFHHDQVLETYDIGLGFAPEGHKQIQGDGRTPEGEYTIDRRNPNSAYHLSIGIDYPRPQDVEAALALGQKPGGDIFIHGAPKSAREKRGGRDWTAGCIAVTDREMETIYAMVRDGTPISIFP